MSGADYKIAGRDAVLDGLRAISIALVLIHHVRAGLGYGVSPLFPFTGVAGVTLFFIISGYLITDLLLVEKRERGVISLSRFYLRRGFRIFPAFYVFLAVMVVARAFGEVSFSSRELLASATYWRNLYQGGQSVLQHTWSLSVEEQFYLGWPLLLKFGRLRHALGFAVAATFIQPVLRFFVRGSYFYESGAVALNSAGLETILVGCILACALRYSDAESFLVQHLRGLTKPWLFGGALYVLYLEAPNMTGPITVILPAVRNLLLAGFLFSVLAGRHHPLGKVLGWRPISFIGVISYSLYLWQQPFLVGVEGRITPLVGISLSLVVAVLSYKWIEQPALRYRRRVE